MWGVLRPDFEGKRACDTIVTLDLSTLRLSYRFKARSTATVMDKHVACHQRASNDDLLVLSNVLKIVVLLHLAILVKMLCCPLKCPLNGKRLDLHILKHFLTLVNIHSALSFCSLIAVLKSTIFSPWIWLQRSAPRISRKMLKKCTVVCNKLKTF